MADSEQQSTRSLPGNGKQRDLREAIVTLQKSVALAREAVESTQLSDDTLYQIRSRLVDVIAPPKTANPSTLKAPPEGALGLGLGLGAKGPTQEQIKEQVKATMDEALRKAEAECYQEESGLDDIQFHAGRRPWKDLDQKEKVERLAEKVRDIHRRIEWIAESSSHLDALFHAHSHHDGSVVVYASHAGSGRTSVVQRQRYYGTQPARPDLLD